MSVTRLALKEERNYIFFSLPKDKELKRNYGVNCAAQTLHGKRDMYAADILKAVHLREISNMSVQLKDYEIKFLILIYAYEFPSLVAKISINAKHI